MKLTLIVAAGLASAPAIANAECKSSLEKSWPYQTEFGNEYLAASLDAQAGFLADCNGAEITASASSTGFVFDAEIPLANTNLTAGIDLESNKYVSADLTVLGFELDGVELNHSSALEWSDSYSTALDLSDDIRFSYGPFTFPLEYGVSGTAKLAVSASFAGLTAQAAGIPSVAADAFAVAGLKSPFLIANLRGDALLIEDNLNALAALKLATDGEGVFVNYGVDVNNQMDALNGTIGFEAYSPWAKDKVYEAELFSYQGYSLNENIVNVDQSIRLK